MAEAQHLLQSLGEIARIVHEGKDPQDLLERMAFAICFNSPWQSSSIMVVDEEARKSVQVAHFSRFISDKRRPVSWGLSISPTADVLASGKPVIIEDALNDRRYMGYWTEAQIEKIRTVVLLPLRVTDNLGRPMVISLQALEKFEVSETMLEYLSTVANLAGMALEKGQRLAAEQAVGVRLESILELQRSVVTQAFRESSLDVLLPLCQRHLPLPFMIVDLVSGRAFCGGFAENDLMNEAVNGAEWRQVEKLFRDRTPTRFEGSRLVELALGSGLGRLQVLAEPILAGGQTIGGIAIAVSGPVNDDLLRTAESIWMALSIALMRQHIVREAGSATTSRLLSDLLEGRMEHVPHGDGMGLLTTQRHRILAIRTERAAVPPNMLIWGLARLAEAADSRIVHGVVGSFVVLMLAEAAMSTDEAERFEDRLLGEARRVAGKEFVMVTSQPCSDLAAYAQAWRQIVRLSDWALERGRYGRVETVDTGVFGVLASLLDFGAVEDFCGLVLKAIREHDEKHGTPLLPTIVALVRHGGRPQPAAHEIGVHITTVRYRMERINELFDLDLRDGDTRFKLDMALRLDAMLSTSVALN